MRVRSLGRAGGLGGVRVVVGRRGYGLKVLCLGRRIGSAGGVGVVGVVGRGRYGLRVMRRCSTGSGRGQRMSS